MKKYFLLSAFLLLGAGCQKPLASTLTQDLPTEIPKESDAIYCGVNGLTRDQVTQKERIYCIQGQDATFEKNSPQDYSFTFIDDLGQRTKNFEIVHEKLMHVIGIRQDLEQFQHVHPEFDPETGIFTLKNFTFATDGLYRLYFDFTPKAVTGEAKKFVVFEERKVGETKIEEVPPLLITPSPQNVDKFVVSLKNLEKKEVFVSGKETKLTFHVDGKDNAPIEHVDNYLGAKGHLVILKEGTLDYLHVHPEEKKLSAMYNDIPFFVTFPEPGKYKMFLEFKHGEKVYHVAYVVEVKKGAGDPLNNHAKQQMH